MAKIPSTCLAFMPEIFSSFFEMNLNLILIKPYLATILIPQCYNINNIASLSNPAAQIL